MSKYRRRAPLKDEKVIFGPYYADFASHTAKLVIEVDGSQHTTDNAIERDARRTATANRDSAFAGMTRWVV